MRGWFKKGSRLVLSVVTSVALVMPSISSAEIVQEPPGPFAMVGDMLVARPMLAAVTGLGALVFVVTLPFSALGGNTKEAAEVLVLEPANSLLFRCLGCTGQEDKARDEARDEARKHQAAVDAAAAEAAATEANKAK